MQVSLADQEAGRAWVTTANSRGSIPRPGCPRLTGKQARAVARLGPDTVGDRARETGRFPGVETADQIRDVAEAGAPQNTGGG